MENNECTYICDQYTEYKENALSIEIKSKVDTHLAICSSCLAIFQQLDQVLSSLQDLKPLTTSPNFTNDLMSKIAAQNKETAWSRIYKSSYSRVAAYAVAAGLVVAIGLNIWIDPISPMNPGGSGNFAGEKDTPAPAIADRTDSINTLSGDSLELKPGAINSETSPLLLVSGKKP